MREYTSIGAETVRERTGCSVTREKNRFLTGAALRRVGISTACYMRRTVNGCLIDEFTIVCSLAQCSRLLGRGDELEFCGDDLLHALPDLREGWEGFPSLVALTR